MKDGLSMPLRGRDAEGALFLTDAQQENGSDLHKATGLIALRLGNAACAYACNSRFEPIDFGCVQGMC